MCVSGFASGGGLMIFNGQKGDQKNTIGIENEALSNQ